MKWQKLGKIFCASNQTEKMVSAGRAPVALKIDEDIYKVFGSYDIDGVASIFSLDLQLEPEVKILNIHTQPILEKGTIGYHDDNGILPSSVLKFDNKIYLYTIGFSIKNKLIFDASLGLAISEDEGKSFSRFDGPLFDRSIYDPCFATSPYVMLDNGIFKMWYVSGDYWEVKNGTPTKHYYNIKHKTSSDGIHWEPKSYVAIDYANEHEYAIARPSVLKKMGNMRCGIASEHKKILQRIGLAMQFPTMEKTGNEKTNFSEILKFPRLVGTVKCFVTLMFLNTKIIGICCITGILMEKADLG